MGVFGRGPKSLCWQSLCASSVPYQQQRIIESLPPLGWNCTSVGGIAGMPTWIDARHGRRLAPSAATSPPWGPHWMWNNYLKKRTTHRCACFPVTPTAYSFPKVLQYEWERSWKYFSFLRAQGHRKYCNAIQIEGALGVYHPGRNYYKIIPWNDYFCNFLWSLSSFSSWMQSVFAIITKLIASK